MQCSQDQILTTSTTNCDQWDSKFSYSSLAIGGNTRLTLLYVNFRNAVEAYLNSFFEGSVAPPC